MEIHHFYSKDALFVETNLTISSMVTAGSFLGEAMCL